MEGRRQRERKSMKSESDSESEGNRGDINSCCHAVLLKVCVIWEQVGY